MAATGSGEGIPGAGPPVEAEVDTVVAMHIDHAHV